jgi:hypothetical protein
LTAAIPNIKLSAIICNFSLDTVFVELYTFVNCKLSIAGRCQNRKRENRTMATKKAAAKKPAKKAAKKAAKKK